MEATPTEVAEFDAGGHPVLMGPCALQALQERLAQLPQATPIVLGDANTMEHCLPELLAHVPLLRSAQCIAIEPGEASKSIGVCQDIWSHLIASAADRHTVLVDLGGGVVTDLGGFIAATFKRGIRCVHVPTSLMGMVDASIGGKTGIDLDHVKNVVGAFHDPLGVYVHMPFLRSLGKRELLNGLAEMIKHGLVLDAAHWHAIRSAALHDLDALAPLVQHSAAIKADVVRRDPREQDLRKVLNFGHTIGHGLEAFSWESPQRELLHGEAVAAGMICEAWLSWNTGRITEEDFERIAQHLLDLFPRYTLQSADDHRILELMRNDKKNAEGELRFTLLDGIGKASVDVPITAERVREALEAYRKL